MNKGTDPKPETYKEKVEKSGLSIYDEIEIGDPDLWIPSEELEYLLRKGLVGISLVGLPLRTRSKVVKEHVCSALGYDKPKSFRKTQPRFPGQNFDSYTQKSNNLQIWNEELSPTRRYAIIRISNEDIITDVRVVTGDVLAVLDTTGTLTQKYQASCIVGSEKAELVSATDTETVSRITGKNLDLSEFESPVAYPDKGTILPIEEVYEKLSTIVGNSFPDLGSDQERNRGGALHSLVCTALGYRTFQDNGQFPDVRHQLIEVKLQTSPTIDLGLVLPSSNDPLDIPKIGDRNILHSDVRYAVFYAVTDGTTVEIKNFFLSTGRDFLRRFPQFQGKVLNKKIQIPLPSDFFRA
jgi:hypothetical protein